MVDRINTISDLSAAALMSGIDGRRQGWPVLHRHSPARLGTRRNAPDEL
jgi:hypothetical protein